MCVARLCSVALSAPACPLGSSPLLTTAYSKPAGFTGVFRGKDTHGTIRPESGAHGMRGSKPAGFSGVGERAARSLDRVSRRRGFDKDQLY